MANSPIIFGGNNTAINLQNQTLQATGELIANDGPKNLITYNRFESGLTTGWSLGVTGTLVNGLPTTTPTFGSGASGNLSIAAASTTPISGNYSLSYVSSAATTAGNMLASDALTVQPGLQAKVLTFKFNYQAFANASNGNFSGTSSNSFGVAVWDVTNSSWLIPAGAFAMTQSSGVGVATGTFQTNATTASIRFVIYNANATAGAITMYFDDFSLGPQTAPIGFAGTDTVSFTPTGNWVSNTTYTGKWRRRGDMMEIEYNLALTGSPTATQLILNLPTGFSIDTAKLNTATSLVTYLESDGAIYDNGVAYSPKLTALYESTTSVRVYYNVVSTHVGNVAISSGQLTNTVPYTLGNTDSVQILVKVPISGWSSNVQMSNDTDTRVVAMQVQAAAPTATITGTFSKLTFGSGVLQDTHSAYSTSTGNYTVPVSGFYRCGASVTVGATYVATQSASIGIAKNGTVIMSTVSVASGASGNQVPTISTTVYANAGDTLAPFVASTGTSPVATSNTTYNWFTVERLSGPSVIAASESVNARYTSTAGAAFTNAYAVLDFATKDYDSHNAVTTGASWKFTAPISGKYSVKTFIKTASFTGAVGAGMAAAVFKNGVQYDQIGSATTDAATAGINRAMPGADTVNLNAGDYIDIRIIKDAGLTVSLTTSAGQVYVAIERVGN